MRLYVDSNILIGYFKQELGGLTQGHLIRVKDFLNLCGKRGYVLVLSDLALREIKGKAFQDKEEIIESLASFKLHFTFTVLSTSDYKSAVKIKEETGIHYPDNLHAQLAISSKCDAIATWNIKDFEKVRGIIDVYRPSEVI